MADNRLHELHLFPVGVTSHRRWQAGHLVVDNPVVVNLLIDHNLTLLSSYDETLGRGFDHLDVETFAWALLQEVLELTGVLAEDEIALIGSHQQAGVRKPSVAGVVV